MRMRPELLAGFLLMAFAAARADDAELLFVRRIQPLMAEKCLSCHGNDSKKIKGGLDLRSRASAMKGGESGKPAFVAKKPDESPMYLAVTRAHEEDWEPMPPKEADKLYAEQVAWIKEWISLGASWPDEERAKKIATENSARWAAEDGVQVKTSGGLSEQWTNRRYKPESLWAYQPVKRRDAGIGSAAIDSYIKERMPKAVNPAPPADRVTLIRRATFDLTGLPPTPEEVAAFVKDSRDDAAAFADVVERLLASPHYGEQMAQHWLDVVRYADSSGFANDYERGNAWRYRDYVVRSFNADKPYDRFVKEQIAGDEIAPGDPEMIVATGFLRMGPWELTAMEVPKVARQRFLDDVANSVGETFLAHSLQCARCHDHKFDPIPTRDYYSLQAVFAATQPSEREAAFLKAENVSGFEEKKLLQTARDAHLATLAELDAKLLVNAQRWFTEKKRDPAKWNEAVAMARKQEKSSLKKGREFEDVFDRARQRMAAQQVAEDQYPPKLVGFAPEDFGRERVARKELERLRWELDRYEPFALAVYNGRTPDVKSINAPVRMPANRMTAGELEQSCILIGGDPFSQGQPVKPGALSVLSAMPNLKSEIPDEIEGRRAAFATWVASADNPLTTRTIVNRVWLWHFNRPLAGNPNNFGSTGGKPTHPELLDWLAMTFVERGWSFKAMHRLIMNSETYRRSAQHPDTKLLAEQDPTGTSYAVFQPRRLTAEELRDAMLAASGELNPALGGIPNRPEINIEAALQPRQVMGTFASAWTPNPKPEQRNRRSLYALKLRGLSDPMLEVFNAPAPDFSCERRTASTVTPQVFSLFNGAASHTRALVLANRAVKETKSDEQAVARCFSLAFGREATKREIADCLSHWRSIEKLTAKIAPVEWKPPLEVRREAVEENTGEKFTFTERLLANEEFVPDLRAADMSPHIRALADICLALFNANEFAYVY